MMNSKWPTKWFITGIVFLVIEMGLKVSAWIYQDYLKSADIEIFSVFDYVSSSLVYVENRHSAFGMLRSVPIWVNQGLLMFSVIVLIVLTYQQATSPDTTAVTRRGMVCFVIGALGNMMDRCTVGAVVDYIDIRIGTYTLAWNISDLVINLGFVHIIYDVLQKKREEKTI